MMQTNTQIEILLVEDSPSDTVLTREALREAKILNSLHTVPDGVEALSFLQRTGVYAGSPRPDLILLDLNMPRMDGRELLALIKHDDDLRRIPTIVLTTSAAESDVLRSYDLHANCYITKPIQFDDFVNAVKSIGEFWFSVVRLPRNVND